MSGEICADDEPSDLLWWIVNFRHCELESQLFQWTECVPMEALRLRVCCGMPRVCLQSPEHRSLHHQTYCRPNPRAPAPLLSDKRMDETPRPERYRRHLSVVGISTYGSYSFMSYSPSMETISISCPVVISALVEPHFGHGVGV